MDYTGLLFPKEISVKKDKHETYTEKLNKLRAKEQKKKEKLALQSECQGLLAFPKEISTKPKASSSKRSKNKPYVPSYPYASIFTNDLKTCYISGKTNNIDIHHIFGGSRKALSEKYHFLLPLNKDWHTIKDYSIHKDRELNLKYKRLCQDHYINVLGLTKDDWLAEFHKWW